MVGVLAFGVRSSQLAVWVRLDEIVSAFIGGLRNA
jgi:hypothetical protein